MTQYIVTLIITDGDLALLLKMVVNNLLEEGIIWLLQICQIIQKIQNVMVRVKVTKGKVRSNPMSSSKKIIRLHSSFEIIFDAYSIC